MKWKVTHTIVFPSCFPINDSGRPAVSLDLSYTDNLQYMDEGIRDILYRFNNLPGFETAWSCQGNYESGDDHGGAAYIAFRRQLPHNFIVLVSTMCPVINIEPGIPGSYQMCLRMRFTRSSLSTPELYQKNKSFATELRAVLDAWERR